MAHLPILSSSKYPENRSWFGDNLVWMGGGGDENKTSLPQRYVLQF
jgi:hypothetical protein